MNATIASPSFRHAPFQATRGFTLIELMISIALVLVLILGVNQVFQYTTQAVGAGQAINSAIRSSRATGSALAQDAANMVPPGNGQTDSACLIISNSQVYAYANKADLAAEGDFSGAIGNLPNSVNGATIPAGAPFQDFASTGKFGDSSVPGDVTAPNTYNRRNHRTDTLSFFARDLFHRQTGNDGVFVDNLASQEAWVWYGHLLLPDNGSPTPNYLPPGLNSAAVNPNNFFAGQFVLGRVAMLLQEKSADSSSGNEGYDTNGNLRQFYNRRNLYPWNGGSAANELDPLWYSSSCNDANFLTLNQSRYDLAATSISNFRRKMQSYLVNPSAPAYWWQQMMDGEYANVPGIGNAYLRFRCNPFVSKPMTSAGMAQAAPYFLGGCSQFTVEFAGDYMIQDNNPSDVKNLSSIPPVQYNYGDYEGPGQDKQIDFQLINTGGIIHKQIIWYGLPRNTSGSSSLTYQGGMPSLTSGKFSMPNGDVAPVSAWVGYVQTFEKALPGNPTPTSGTSYAFNPSMANGDKYVCAWGPYDVKPKLIRITLTLDDPTGRLPDGQTYQYVFAVP